MHSLIRNVGRGSNRHDFVGDALIILSTASSETCLKTVIWGGSEGGLTSYSVPEEAKLSLITHTDAFLLSSRVPSSALQSTRHFTMDENDLNSSQFVSKMASNR